jgi:hypothetical protein
VRQVRPGEPLLRPAGASWDWAANNWRGRPRSIAAPPQAATSTASFEHITAPSSSHGGGRQQCGSWLSHLPRQHSSWSSNRNQRRTPHWHNHPPMHMPKAFTLQQQRPGAGSVAVGCSCLWSWQQPLAAAPPLRGVMYSWQRQPQYGSTQHVQSVWHCSSAAAAAAALRKGHTCLPPPPLPCTPWTPVAAASARSSLVCTPPQHHCMLCGHSTLPRPKTPSNFPSLRHPANTPPPPHPHGQGKV